jgi:hypothetical protein
MGLHGDGSGGAWRHQNRPLGAYRFYVPLCTV